MSHSVYQNRLTDHLPNPLSVPFMSYDARVKKRHPPRKRDECHFLLVISSRISKKRQNDELVVLGSSTLFLNASLLTRKVTEVVKLSTTYFTNFVHFDAFDVG